MSRSILRIVRLGLPQETLCGVCERLTACSHFDHDMKMGVCPECKDPVKSAELELLAWLPAGRSPEALADLALDYEGRPWNGRKR